MTENRSKDLPKARSPYPRIARIGIASILAAWLVLLISGGGFLVGREFAPATGESLGTTESGMVSWTPARDARLICRYFNGRKIVEALRGVPPGQSPDDAHCPWFLNLRDG